MIVGPEAWERNIAAERKRALYLVELPEFGLIITSFVPTDVGIASGIGGWGVMLWGVDPWGS